jgi:hypothetical protein
MPSRKRICSLGRPAGSRRKGDLSSRIIGTFRTPGATTDTVRLPECLEHRAGAHPSLASFPISFTRGSSSPGWDLEDCSACPPRLNLRPSCSSPPQLIQAICHSRDPQRSKPWLEDGQRRGTRIPCDSPGVPYPIRRGSEGSQKAFSLLSEGVRGVFTVSTESSETAVSCT